MIRIFEVKVGINKPLSALQKRIAEILAVEVSSITKMVVRKRALDARKKSDIQFVYTVDVLLQKGVSPKYPLTHKNTETPDESYQAALPGSFKLNHRPVVVGSGPAGLFCALILAQAGYAPLVLERGAMVETRKNDVARFWETGRLNVESNAQFGEGGAGTFSDGKLATLINDTRCRKVLTELVMAGADADILVSSKPHVGTDCLQNVVVALRKKIILLGGEFRFQSKVTDSCVLEKKLSGIFVNHEEQIPCDIAVFAIGHSARDTIPMLYNRGVEMAQKPFSMGVRIEHLQSAINYAQFGCAHNTLLGAADYKLAFHAPNGRSAYTFCMCPGGHVIAASSEENHLVTNGMSYSKRDGVNANAAFLVNVMPSDFPSDHVLSGFDFQRTWESAVFVAGGSNYCAPVQLVGDFLKGVSSKSIRSVLPTYTPGIKLGSLSLCLPSFVLETMRLALPFFAQNLKAFADPDALLTGIETRSSSPIRIIRNENYETSVTGLYCAGEGGGHSGGITSSAVDGIKCAEEIIKKYRPCT